MRREQRDASGPGGVSRDDALEGGGDPTLPKALERAIDDEVDALGLVALAGGGLELGATRGLVRLDEQVASTVGRGEGPPASISWDGKWIPNQTLLPVPVGREDEAREVLEFLTALADER